MQKRSWAVDALHAMQYGAVTALNTLQAYAMQDDWGNRFAPLSHDTVDELLAVFTPQQWHVMAEAVIALAERQQA